MRMWMVPVEFMCGHHRRGEHLEIHMFIDALKRGLKLDGYLRNNLLEPQSLKTRHDTLSQTLQTHLTPIKDDVEELIGRLPYKMQEKKIDVKRAWADLIKRCPDCRKLCVDKHCVIED